ncbi:unnamed protein product [Symbiodinium sp. KB8]|nr:unnamed protein product [Symbiodinium sp. KB8]
MFACCEPCPDPGPTHPFNVETYSDASLFLPNPTVPRKFNFAKHRKCFGLRFVSNGQNMFQCLDFLETAMRPDVDELDFAWLVAQQVTGHIRARCPSTSSTVVVIAGTVDYRNLARHLVSAEDHVIEVGSSLGHCTEILHARREQDIFEEADRLAALPAAARCKKVFLDIGGDRQKLQVLHAIDILRRCMPKVQLIVVKSEELHSAMASWTGCASSASNGEGLYLERPSEFLHSAEGSAAPLRLPKQRRATRVRSLAQNQVMASADPERWFSRREIEAALPSFSNMRGFCLARDEESNAELATCLFLHHEQNPLFLDHAACCIYADDKEVEALMRRCGKHAIPVFWGQGGGAVMQEFLGSYEIVDMLPLSHSLYEAPALCEHLQGLRRRSRRPMTGPQLLQMKYVEAARESTYPEHPCKCSDPSAWLQEILRRVQWHENAAQVGDIACNTLPSLPFMALPCSSTKLHRQIEVRRGRGQHRAKKRLDLKGVYHYAPLQLLLCFTALPTNHNPIISHHTSDQIILRVLVVVLVSLQPDFDLTSALARHAILDPLECPRSNPFRLNRHSTWWDLFGIRGWKSKKHKKRAHTSIEISSSAPAPHAEPRCCKHT